MDTVTQAVLGATVGQVCLGHRVGPKAALWGAALGTVPDLDVFWAERLPGPEALAVHRGITHSLAFCIVAGLAFGYLASRVHRRDGVGQRAWSWLTILALVTHPLLDCFTNYGTQLFLPISNYRVHLDSIFDIDPLFTVPLLLGLAASVHAGRSPRARRAAGIGLSVACAYLAMTLVNQQRAASAFRDSLIAQETNFDRLFTAPTAFNSVLWMGVAHSDDTVYIALFSLFDDGRDIVFVSRARRDDLIAPWSESRYLRDLQWFTDGVYHVTQDAKGIFVHDLRFGRADFWFEPASSHRQYPYPYTFRLYESDEGKLVGFERMHFEVNVQSIPWRRFIRRIVGRSGVDEGCERRRKQGIPTTHVRHTKPTGLRCRTTWSSCGYAKEDSTWSAPNHGDG